MWDHKQHWWLGITFLIVYLVVAWTGVSRLQDDPQNPKSDRFERRETSLASKEQQDWGQDGADAANPVAAEIFPKRPAYQASVRLDWDGPRHRVGDGIFGVCTLPTKQLAKYGIPITRWGGNASSRFNWMINADNGASDWFFKNRGAPISDLAETGYVKHIRLAQAAGATSYMTLPMLGWVAKDRESYSFPVKKYGPQQRTEPGCDDVGNGVSPNGKPIRADPRDTSIRVGPEFVAEAAAFVVKQTDLAQRGENSRRGLRYWALDNEPMLWHKTHRDVRPTPLGYDELWERTVAYAEAIKKADPTAKVAGFCSWGWNDLFCSAKDDGRPSYDGPDYWAHGLPLAEWYLRKCAEWKKKNGRPLIDVFDFHWYPQCKYEGNTPCDGKGMAAALNELRLRSTRDLWDPDYVQESWIGETAHGQRAQVIRRVRGWIEKHNPGMELCIGEYNFGGQDNVTGGLAQADLFGIFAQEQVDLAFIWTKPEGTQNLAWRLFRNYDDEGGRFGEEFIPTISNHPDLAVYAAKRGDGAVTIVVINKNLGGACDLTLSASKLNGRLRVWHFDQTTTRVAEIPENAATIEGKIVLTLPAASASMLVVK